MARRASRSDLSKLRQMVFRTDLGLGEPTASEMARCAHASSIRVDSNEEAEEERIVLTFERPPASIDAILARVRTFGWRLLASEADRL